MRFTDWLWYRPNPLKWLLWPIGGIYGVVMEIRRLVYRLGMKSVTTLPLPVIVVGNLTVGGSGKTPVVIWLAAELKSCGYRVGIVSRGYGGNAESWPQRVSTASDPGLVGDEPVLIARATGCPVMVSPDRVAAAKALISAEQLDVLLADDGMQHYALDRTLAIAVVDGQRGLGDGFCLPAGPLREFKCRIADVDAIVVNGRGWGRAGVFRAQPAAQRLHQVAGSEQKLLAEFRNTEVHAVAGIGNPQRFFNLLEDAGVDVLPHPLPDHTKLTGAELDFDDARPVFVTEKDAVKCEGFARENVWCVPIKLEFDAEDGQRLMRRVLRDL
jgi:tetraacyldisaccharide 4'-kinase